MGLVISGISLAFVLFLLLRKRQNLDLLPPRTEYPAAPESIKIFHSKYRSFYRVWVASFFLGFLLVNFLCLTLLRTYYPGPMVYFALSFIGLMAIPEFILFYNIRKNGEEWHRGFQIYVQNYIPRPAPLILFTWLSYSVYVIGFGLIIFDIYLIFYPNPNIH